MEKKYIQPKTGRAFAPLTPHQCQIMLIAADSSLLVAAEKSGVNKSSISRWGKKFLRTYDTDGPEKMAALCECSVEDVKKIRAYYYRRSEIFEQQKREAWGKFRDGLISTTAAERILGVSQDELYEVVLKSARVRPRRRS